MDTSKPKSHLGETLIGIGSMLIIFSFMIFEERIWQLILAGIGVILIGIGLWQYSKSKK